VVFFSLVLRGQSRQMKTTTHERMMSRVVIASASVIVGAFPLSLWARNKAVCTK
jgi:hypothetical protein